MTTSRVQFVTPAVKEESQMFRIPFIQVFVGVLLVSMICADTVHAQNYFIGEIRVVAFNTVPTNWMECNGQTLQISSYNTLFNAIGITYGGDGTTTFVLPNLNGRIAVGAGQGSSLSNYNLGQSGGDSAVTLTVNQIPSHSHLIMADTATGGYVSPSGHGLAKNAAGIPMFATSTTGAMASGAVDSTGGGQAHNNLMPYLGMKFIIAVQ